MSGLVSGTFLFFGVDVSGGFARFRSFFEIFLFIKKCVVRLNRNKRFEHTPGKPYPHPVAHVDAITTSERRGMRLRRVEAMAWPLAA